MLMTFQRYVTQIPWQNEDKAFISTGGQAGRNQC